MFVVYLQTVCITWYCLDTNCLLGHGHSFNYNFFITLMYAASIVAYHYHGKHAGLVYFEGLRNIYFYAACLPGM